MGDGRKKAWQQDLASRLPDGDLDPEDRRENERALRRGGRLLSAYVTRLQERLWVITEWDRSATTLLLPEEY